MLDKDVKYAQKQVTMQKECVENLQRRVDKKTGQLASWDVAIKSIKEQRKYCKDQLDMLKTEYKTQLKDLQKMESHLKDLQTQKNMLRNQRKSVED